MMGLELHYYDLYAPLVVCQSEISVDVAEHNILEAPVWLGPNMRGAKRVH
jgi:hypothetical protein